MRRLSVDCGAIMRSFNNNESQKGGESRYSNDIGCILVWSTRDRTAAKAEPKTYPYISLPQLLKSPLWTANPITTFSKEISMYSATYSFSSLSPNSLGSLPSTSICDKLVSCHVFKFDSLFTYRTALLQSDWDQTLASFTTVPVWGAWMI